MMGQSIGPIKWYREVAPNTIRPELNSERDAKLPFLSWLHGFHRAILGALHSVIRKSSAGMFGKIDKIPATAWNRGTRTVGERVRPHRIRSLCPSFSSVQPTG